MEALARGHARMSLRDGNATVPLPDLVGAEQASLLIRRSEGLDAGPPAGAVRYPARWISGRRSGEAEVLVLPLWAWAAEIHVTLGPPSPLRRLGMTKRELDRLAARLAAAVADGVTQLPGEARRDRPAVRRRGGGWALRSATTGSPSP